MVPDHYDPPAKAGGNLAGGNLAGGNLAGGNLAGGNLDGSNLTGGDSTGDSLVPHQLPLALASGLKICKQIIGFSQMNN
jgi:uncharacterized protein YjbI with pentapeptide repeats